MLLAPIEARLKDQVAALNRNVAGAVDFAAAEGNLKSVPAAFVLPLIDKAGPNNLACGGIEQRVVERFGVALVVNNASDARGAAAHTALEPLRRAVIDALLGWPPGAEYDPCEYGGGRILKLNGMDLWWQLDFTTAYFERKV